MASVKENTVIVIVAKRNSGKSFLVRDIMFHHQGIPLGMVISPTEHANRFYGDFVPDVFIHDEYDPELIANILKRQRMVMTQLNRGTKLDPRAFLIMDDCMYDNKRWINDPNIRSIFTNGRHYSLMYILTMQYVLGITPQLRGQVDYVFLLREPSIANQKRIYQNFGGAFPSFEVFSQVFGQITQNYECMVVNNSARSNRLEDEVFWYKAAPRPTFRIGAPVYWSMRSDEYEEYMDGQARTAPDQQADALMLSSRSRWPVVVVRKRVDGE
jgi:hypothetical protein